LLRSLAKRTFDLYTAPARFAFRQGRKGVDRARQLKAEFRQNQLEMNVLADNLLQQAANALGVEPDKMTAEQREFAARMALSRAEQGLSLALQEILRAVVLMTAPGSGSRGRSAGPPDIIEGDFERLKQ
jgi:hypothetical protein